MARAVIESGETLQPLPVVMALDDHEFRNDYNNRISAGRPQEFHAAATAWHWVDYVPVRVTALAFAVVGNFEEAVASWRGDAERFAPGSDGVVLAATSGAINVRLTPQSPDALTPIEEGDPGARPDPQLAHLSSVVGLVWRAVVLWMLLLALLTLNRSRCIAMLDIEFPQTGRLAFRDGDRCAREIDRAGQGRSREQGTLQRQPRVGRAGHRVAHQGFGATRRGRSSLAGRAVDYLTFHVSTAWRLWRLLRSGDIVGEAVALAEDTTAATLQAVVSAAGRVLAAREAGLRQAG